MGNKQILYNDDWFFEREGRLHRRAMVHARTKNTSFIRMHRLLKDMGISNNKFMLALFDPALQDVDPHKLNSTTDPTGILRKRVGIEVHRNVWYFFREILKVPVQGQIEGIPFRLDRGNMAMIWTFFNNINYNGMQPRQTGKTYCAIGLTCYVEYIIGRKINVTMYTHQTKLVHENVARLKGMRDSLPPYLLNLSRDDEDNKEGLSYEFFDNKYLTIVGQKDRASANNVGRGKSGPVIHIDEIAFIPNIDISYSVLMSSTNKARDTAKNAGMPHSNLYTTTAADPRTPSGKYALDLVNGAMPFSEKLYDLKNNEALQDMVAKNSTNSIISGVFSHLMLGLSNEWLAKKLRENNIGPVERDRDYLLKWTVSNEMSIVSPDILERMTNTIAEPNFVEFVNDFAVSWYVDRATVKSAAFRRTPMIFGMDSSGMIGRDFTTFVCIDPTSLRVMFTFRCNEGNLQKLGILIAELLMMYPNMLFVPERKSTGEAIIDHVTTILVPRGVNPFLRIFNKIVNDRHMAEFKDINLDDLSLANTNYKKLLGFMTTANTRSVLYKQTIQKAASLAADRIFDRQLVTEISGLSVVNGRVDHGAGKHDDMVIAWLLACYALFEGKNLDMYGIPTSSILSGIPSQSTADKPNYEHLKKQMNLRRQIREMEGRMMMEQHDSMKLYYKHQIDMLRTYIDTSLVLEPINTDAVKRDIALYGDMYVNSDRPKPARRIDPTGMFSALL